MQTNDLIKDLSGRLSPAPRHSPAQTALFWAAGTAALLGLYFWLLPVRPDLGSRLGQLLYQTENLIFLALFVVTALVAYRSSIPGALRPDEQRWALFLMAGFVMLLFFHLRSWRQMPAELLTEFDWYRGRCGPILLILGAFEASLGLWLAARGACTSPAATGAWVGLFAGSLGLFANQFICTHENFLHIILWHFTPVGLLAAGGAFFGKRLLKW